MTATIENGARAGAVGSGQTLISVKDCCKSFMHRDGRIDALAGCNLDIAAGEFISLLGPSGCGKSTLLRIIGGLATYEQGTVTVGGRPPRDTRAQKGFGFVPQAPGLMPWRDVRANIEISAKINKKKGVVLDRQRVDDLLAMVNLQNFAHAYPRELSGGMQQRVALVRAFALGAPILLMDEPFAALDEITREAMRYQLLEMWQNSGTTVVFVTHSLAEAVILSDRVAVMSARPGCVTTIETISLARPRVPELEETEQFLHHLTAVRTALRSGWGPAKAR